MELVGYEDDEARSPLSKANGQFTIKGFILTEQKMAIALAEKKIQKSILISQILIHHIGL